MRSFFTALVAVSAAGLGFGIVLPVTSVVLEEVNTPTPVIGLMATVMFLGLAFGAPFAGRCIELYGLRRVLSGGLITVAISMVGIGFVFSLPAWFILRFIMGAAFASVFTSCETLINRTSTEKNRGRNLGFYGFAFSVCLMAGPAGLFLLKYGLWFPFLLTGLGCCISAVVVTKSIPLIEEKKPKFKFDMAFIRILSPSLTAMVMCGFMEGALISLIPVFALREGFTEFHTGILLFAFMIGHGGLTPLIGILGDRIGLRKILLITYGIGAASFSFLVFLPSNMSISVLLLTGGAAVGALYPLGVGLLGEILPHEDLPRGNAMTTFCYGIGSIIGPFVPSVIMHFFLPKSLFLVSALIYVSVLLVMIRKLSQPR